MKARSDDAAALGIGIYNREEAARFIGVNPTRLRRWVGGYTYRYHYKANAMVRHRPPVVGSDLPAIDDTIALSFLELMELRVVARLRKMGVSLQEIRAAATAASEYFDTHYPFASRRVFTDGRRVFAATNEGQAPDLVELRRKRIAQVIAGGILEPFVNEMDFEDDTGLSKRWWPLGKSVPVVLDPAIAFGAPTALGTRLQTVFIAELANGLTAQEIATTYRVPLDRVEAALQFESQLRAA